MKHIACVMKRRRASPPTNAQLPRRWIALQKLREKVRVAEVAMKPRTDAPFPRHQ